MGMAVVPLGHHVNSLGPAQMPSSTITMADFEYMYLLAFAENNFHPCAAPFRLYNDYLHT